MGGDFDKSEEEISPYLRALQGAQNKRKHTGTSLKEELSLKLKDQVITVLEKLPLEGIIAAAAIKGITSFELEIVSHADSKTCVSVSDDETGHKLEKTWKDFYVLLCELISDGPISASIDQPWLHVSWGG